MPAASPGRRVAAQIPPPDDSLNATVWFQTSVERDLVFRGIYRAAGARLDAALADKGWDALPKEDRGNDPRALPPAIIVDVDETVLDNSPNQVRQIRDGSGFNEASVGRVGGASARRKPLPGALEFLRAAAAKRRDRVLHQQPRCEPGRGDVRQPQVAGFPIRTTASSSAWARSSTAANRKGSEKSCRRQLVGRKHRVLMQFGDQLGDFVRSSPIPATAAGKRSRPTPTGSASAGGRCPIRCMAGGSRRCSTMPGTSRRRCAAPRRKRRSTTRASRQSARCSRPRYSADCISTRRDAARSNAPRRRSPP